MARMAGVGLSPPPPSLAWSAEDVARISRLPYLTVNERRALLGLPPEVCGRSATKVSRKAWDGLGKWALIASITEESLS